MDKQEFTEFQQGIVETIATLKQQLQTEESSMSGTQRHITVYLNVTRADIENELRAHGIDPQPHVLSEVIQQLQRTAIDAARSALVEIVESKQKENKG